jgi:hypothetical protein
MSKLSCGDDDYTIDDDSFEEGAGINAITKAYAAVFKTIKDIADKAEKAAVAGQTKEFMNCIKIIQNKSSQLSDLQALTSPIIGANGVVYNTLGAPINDATKGTEDDPSEEPGEPMDEAELLKRIQEIEKNNIVLNFSDAQAEIESQENANNITDNGEDHGDVGDVDW